MRPYERLDDYLIADVFLMRQGVHTVGTLHKLFNEKVLGHEEMDVTWEYWKEYTYDLINGCDELYVLCLDGWKDSKGVTDEIAYAKEHGKPVRYVNLSFNGDENNHELEIHD